MQIRKEQNRKEQNRKEQIRRAQIRRVREDEGELLREIRLGALMDAPSAFDSSISAERELLARVWERRAAAGAAGVNAVTYFAEDDGGEVVGLVTGLRDVDGAGDVLVVSMWVAQRARGQGLGRRLLDVVVDWAGQVGAPYVELWVTDGNEPARTLYEKAGFTPTGVRAPLDTDPSLTGIKLRRSLDG